jgi:Family of unknown function (DUF5706)
MAAMGAQNFKSPDDPKKRLEKVAYDYFDHVERQINLAVTKSSLLVAAAALAGGIFVKFVTDHRGLLVDYFPIFLASAAGLLLLAGLLCALVSIWPRFTPAEDAHGALFFGAVAQDKLDDFKKKFGELGDHENLYNELLSQIWGKSNWLARMYRWASYSILCLGAGTVLVALAILLLGRTAGPDTGKPGDTVLQMQISLDGLIDSSQRKAVKLDCGMPTKEDGKKTAKQDAKEEYLIETFETGKAVLGTKKKDGSKSRSIDAQVDDALGKLKEDAKGRRLQGILLVGSADKTVPGEGRPTNDQLAKQRSDAVKEILNNRKADLDQLKLTSKMIVSLNPEVPIARLIVEDKIFDAMRAVRICAIWEAQAD